MVTHQGHSGLLVGLDGVEPAQDWALVIGGPSSEELAAVLGLGQNEGFRVPSVLLGSRLD